MPQLFGQANGRWKGGTWVNSSGYVMVWVGRDHPMASCRAYAKRCRVVCYETHGAPEAGQHAHHINGNKQDDAPENLEWRYPTEHGRHHLTPERARKLGRKGGLKVARMRRREQRQLVATQRYARNRKKASPRRRQAA